MGTNEAALFTANMWDHESLYPINKSLHDQRGFLMMYFDTRVEACDMEEEAEGLFGSRPNVGVGEEAETQAAASG